MGHQGQAKLDAIKKAIADGSTIYIYTYGRCVEVSPRTFARFGGENGPFKVDAKDSLYIARGKAWDCIDYTSIKTGK